MIRRVGILLAALLTACAVGGPRHPTGPASYAEAASMAPEGQERASIYLVAAADEALESGDLGAARSLASRALRLFGDNPYAYYLLAEVAAASGEHDVALRYLGEARLLLEPQQPSNEVWLARTLRLEARLLEENGQPGEARALRGHADRLAPDPGGTR